MVSAQPPAPPRRPSHPGLQRSRPCPQQERGHEEQIPWKPLEPGEAPRRPAASGSLVTLPRAGAVRAGQRQAVPVSGCAGPGHRPRVRALLPLPPPAGPRRVRTHTLLPSPARGTASNVRFPRAERIRLGHLVPLSLLRLGLGRGTPHTELFWAQGTPPCVFS